MLLRKALAELPDSILGVDALAGDFRLDLRTKQFMLK